MIQELLLEYGAKNQNKTFSESWNNVHKSLSDNSDSINERLKNNLKIVRRDIWQADYLVYNLLEPEMRQQRFRMMVSMAFIILVAMLLFMFFFTIYRKSGKNIYRQLLGSSGLQFVTIFVLIIAIILFGILGVIEGSELAAILSGISGYVLGKQIKENDQTPLEE